MSRHPDTQQQAVMHLISSLGMGGAERLLVNLIRSCAATQDFQHVVVVMNERVDPSLVAELESTSVPVYYLSRPESGKSPRYLWDLIKIIRAHRVAVIHSHNNGSKYWSMLCRLVIKRLKLVFTLHDTKIGMSRRDVLLHNAVIDVTIAISPAVASEARSLRIKGIAQINNGIPTSHFGAVSPRAPKTNARIVSVARLLPEKKGQDVLIRAVKRCVDRGLDVECLLVGSPLAGDLQTLPTLQALVASLSIRERVHFIQGESDVARLLGDANIFVMASRFEGFGLALVEAMAAGLPVIASSIDGPADILTDGVDGLLFESDSDEQLAEKLEFVIRFPSLAEQLGANGRETAKKYDISVMRDRYLAVYSRLITGR